MCHDNGQKKVYLQCEIISVLSKSEEPNIKWMTLQVKNKNENS